MKNSLTFETFEKSCILLLFEKNLNRQERCDFMMSCFLRFGFKKKIVKDPSVIKEVLFNSI